MSEVKIFTDDGVCQTVHLPMLLPTSGTYTIRTGQPIRIEPGFQEVEITITKVSKPREGE